MVGDLKVLFTTKVGPVWYSICWFVIVLVVRGLLQSKKEELVVSISHPRTKALPGETWYKANPSDGVDPPAVIWLILYSHQIL